LSFAAIGLPLRAALCDRLNAKGRSQLFVAWLTRFEIFDARFR
jgi:hypothetical protein